MIVRYILVSVLACSAISFTLSAQTRPLVGAIRWDARVDPITGDGMGESDQIALTPVEWRARLPFFSTISAIGKVRIALDSQAAMDLEIAYAKAGAIDYWAFDYYGQSDGNSDALKKYLVSSRKSDIKFSLILLDIAFDTAFDWSQNIAEYMGDPQYVRVLNGRPLVYLFVTSAVDGSMVAELRNAAIAQGLPNPYIVAMTWSPFDGETQRLGADAVSAYAMVPNGPAKTEQPYSTLAASDRWFWDAAKTSSLKLVPLVSTGWDPRPRYYYPPPWGAGTETAVATGTPSEVAQHVKAAESWVDANPGVAESNAIIVYAWNEFAEGGSLAPRIWEGSARLDAINAVRRGTSSPDIMPPVVSVTSPGVGALLQNGVTLTAAASDNTGIASVQFLIDGTNLGAPMLAPPFTRTWATTILNDGPHTLTAIAVDRSGNRSTSQPVSVTVINGLPVPNQLPVVYAGNDRTVTFPSKVFLGSVVLDDKLPSNTLTTQWKNGAGVTFEDPAARGTFATFPAPGQYTIKLTASDGQLGVNNELKVTVEPDVTPPAVAVTAPAGNATVSGSAVSITASASDAGGVTNVEIIVGGVTLVNDAAAPYTASWNTTSVSHNSERTVTARAYDASGNVSTASITVKVADVTPPSVTITSPANNAQVAKNTNVTFSANAADVSGVWVDFLVNGKRVCADGTAPLSCVWTVPNTTGITYTLTANAYDAAGNLRSAVVTVKSK